METTIGSVPEIFSNSPVPDDDFDNNYRKTRKSRGSIQSRNSTAGLKPRIKVASNSIQKPEKRVPNRKTRKSRRSIRSRNSTAGIKPRIKVASNFIQKPEIIVPDKPWYLKPKPPNILEMRGLDLKIKRRLEKINKMKQQLLLDNNKNKAKNKYIIIPTKKKKLGIFGNELEFGDTGDENKKNILLQEFKVEHPYEAVPVQNPINNVNLIELIEAEFNSKNRDELLTKRKRKPKGIGVNSAKRKKAFFNELGEQNELNSEIFNNVKTVKEKSVSF